MPRLPLADIRMDTSLQPRASIDESTVKEYADRMQDGDTFPAITVFYDGTDYWLADGYHRAYAARELKQTHIDVAIHQGAREDAAWYSFGVNKTHGLKRTNVDKRRAVEAALNHPIGQSRSDTEIARHCGVAVSTVSRYRESIYSNAIDTPLPRQVTRNGTTYAMQTQAIGRGETRVRIVRPLSYGEIDAFWGKSPSVDDFKPDVEVVPMTAAQTSIPAHVFTLPAWDALSAEEQSDVIEDALCVPTNKKFNKQEGESIEWARWSWNPVTGCYHGCIYCYARDIAERFYPHKFDAALMADRLSIPRYQSPPAEAAHEIGYRNVFTCSMADLFGKWVPQPWIDAVLDTVKASPKWNFLFLTKFPIRLSEQEWPDNAWVGCTVDTQARVSSAERAFSKVKAGVKWLSCEPLLEPLQFNSLEMFDWIVIGGQSRSSQAPEFQPKWEWVENLVEQARASGCKVYFKTNLIARPKEYPFGEVQ